MFEFIHEVQAVVHAFFVGILETLRYDLFNDPVVALMMSQRHSLQYKYGLTYTNMLQQALLFPAGQLAERIERYPPTSMQQEQLPYRKTRSSMVAVQCPCRGNLISLPLKKHGWVLELEISTAILYEGQLNYDDTRRCQGLLMSGSGTSCRPGRSPAAID